MNVRVSNLSQSFVRAPREDGDYVLRDLSLEVPAGEIFSILGPSGCGKTTLLRCILGLQAPTTGTVELDGGPPDAALNSHVVGFVPQRQVYFEWLNAYENVTLAVKISGKEPNAADVESLMRSIGIWELRKSSPSQLSGGQLARVAFARAIAHRPSHVFLDEPFTNLDEPLRLEMLRLFYTHARRNETTVIMVSHDILDAIMFSDSVLTLSRAPSNIIDVQEIGLPSNFEDRLTRMSKAVKIRERILKKFPRMQ